MSVFHFQRNKLVKIVTRTQFVSSTLIHLQCSPISRQEANATYIHQVDNKSKATWDTINKKRQRRIGPETNKLEIHYDEELLTETGTIAHFFSQYFASI